MSAATEHPTAPVTPPEGSRAAARARMPVATHVIEHVASEHGVCLHPVPLRRIDPDTGASEVVYADCGATADDKCAPCATRKRRQRMAQCREGWHAETEPVVEADEPNDAQKRLASLRADLELAHRNALADGEDPAPIESAIEDVEKQMADAGVRGSVSRSKPTKVRSTKRRQDVPDLPATKVAPVTIGRTYTGNNGKTYRPSVFITSPCPPTATIFAAAADDELLAKNPCRAPSVRRPRADPRKVVPWEQETVRHVRDCLPQRYRVVATLAAGLGLRHGEIFGLSPDDVDFLRGRVEIRRQVKLYASNRQAFALPKCRKTRIVPLPDSGRDELGAHLTRYPAQAVTLPWETVSGEDVTVPLLLWTRERSALNRNYFNTYVWKRALTRLVFRHHGRTAATRCGTSTPARSSTPVSRSRP